MISVVGIRLVVLFMALLALVGCAESPAEGMRGRVEANACGYAFVAALGAWTQLRGAVPEACMHVDEHYELSLVPELPPGCASPGTVGCTVFKRGHRQVLLLESLDEQQRVDVATHEWVHVLLDCVNGDPDYDHLAENVWSWHDQSTVLGDAVAIAPLGPCM